MKVDVSWGRRNTNATYHLRAPDLEAALKALKTLPEWGEFAGHSSAKWRQNAQGEVTAVTLEPTFSIKMPSWGAYKKQPQECKDAWDAMFNALRKHEDGHRELFEELVRSLVTKLEALETATPDQIKDMLATTEHDVQDRSDKYDTETDHGVSQGVTLDITEACRSKGKAR